MSAAPTSVLVVEDNPTSLKLISRVLELEGFAVRTATSAVEALNEMGAETPSVLVTDIQLPGIDGLELVRRVRATPQLADLPIVAVTAHAMENDRMRILAAGCDEHLTKPIDAQALVRIVSEQAAEGRA